MKAKVIVLNLIITGIPSIQKKKQSHLKLVIVLNLIITGIPSIHLETVANVEEITVF